MEWAEFKAGVKQHKGWIEGDKAFFPSPHLKDEFVKWWSEHHENDSESERNAGGADPQGDSQQ